MKLNKNLMKNQEKWQKFKKKDKVTEKPRFNYFIKTWKEFAENSSIHAIHYLTAEAVNLIGKLFWLCVILAGSLAMVYCCILLSERFRSNLTATVFESTNFPVTEIPFAQITLCNNNRLNYNKTERAVEKFVGNYTQQQKNFFVKFLHTLQNMEYGSFDEFESLEAEYNGFLDRIRITDVYKFMMHDCEDFLTKCLWREKPIKCCEIFSRQVTEYGICFSFNSYSNEGTTFINRSDHFPWRIADKGKRSALSVSMNLHLETKIERTTGNDKEGILAFVQHPQHHPSTGNFIAVKSLTALVIKPTAFSTSDDVSRLHPADRQCYYNHESSKLKGLSINGLPYMRTNCMSACRHQHMIKYCNCSFEFLFFADAENPECNMTQIFCLMKYNDLFNMEKPLVKSPYFDDNEEGIVCECLPECSRIEYDVAMEPIYDEKPVNDGIVKIDVHYGSTTMIKYRTDVVYTWVDLMVGFGGILGLFFGCSLLSGVEIFFYSTIALYYQYQKSKGKIVKSIQAKFPFLN